MEDEKKLLISDIEAVILGLLAEKPRYGYELEKIINKRGLRMWTSIGFSSIYYVLKRLETNGLVSSREKEGKKGKPSRRIYECSSQGTYIMHNKIIEILSTFQKVISPYDLAVAFAGLLPIEEEIEYVRQSLHSSNLRIAFLRGEIKRHTAEGYTFHMLAHFERHLYYAEAEKKWIQRYLDYLLKKGNSAVRTWVEPAHINGRS